MKIYLVSEEYLRKVVQLPVTELSTDEVIIQTLLSKGIYPFRATMTSTQMGLKHIDETLQYHVDDKGLWWGTTIKTVDIN